MVIAKEIRDRLGIEPGWLALQRVVNEHLEIYFVPPEHRNSLKGSLAQYLKVSIAPGPDWDKARQEEWDEEAIHKADQGPRTP